MGQLYKWIERLVGNKPSHQGHQSRVSCQAAMDVQDEKQKELWAKWRSAADRCEVVSLHTRIISIDFGWIYIYIISVRTLLGFHCSWRSICPFVTSLVDYFPLLFGDASNLDSEFILSMGIEYQDQHLPGSSKNLTFSDILSYVPCRIAPQIILNTPQ